MEVMPYEPKYKADFFRLNMEWLEGYGLLEQEDLTMMETMDGLIRQGAMAYIALEDEEVLAVCMIRPLGRNLWELCKLSAAKQHQGKGAGKAVFRACMDYAENHGAEKVILVSNHVLTKALRMYEKYGFRSVPLEPEHAIYETADIQMEYVFEKEGGSNADRTL